MNTAELLIGGVFALVLIETALNWRWVRPYYRIGLPLYRARIPYAGVGMERDLSQVLTQRLVSTSTASLVFARLAPNEYGFREKLYEPGFRFRYTPIMRGLVEFAPIERAIIVTGRLNWSVLGFVAYVIFSLTRAPRGIATVAMLGLTAIIGLCYGMQVARFRTTGREIQRLVSNCT